MMRILPRVFPIPVVDSWPFCWPSVVWPDGPPRLLPAAELRFRTASMCLLPMISAPLAGKRVGLITNPTGVTRDLRSTIDVLARLQEGQAGRPVRARARRSRQRPCGRQDRRLARPGHRPARLLALRQEPQAHPRDAGRHRRAGLRRSGHRLLARTPTSARWAWAWKPPPRTRSPSSFSTAPTR